MLTVHEDDRVRLIQGDCVEVLASLPDASVDAVVTDPPYGLNFMSKTWDSFRATMPGGICEECGNDLASEGYRLCLHCLEVADIAALRHAFMVGHQSQNWSRKETHSRGYADNDNRAFGRWCGLWATECLRVLKPGGHLLAFGGTRTWHRLACAIEDAGFEIRDSIAWMYGSGFPKSLDVSKAIDKAEGHWRGKRGDVASTNGAMAGPNYERTPKGNPVTAAAAAAAGWGTALKPAHEPIVVARKPLAGTVAANVLEHGTGALNIDGCRIDMGLEDRVVVDARSGGSGGGRDGFLGDVDRQPGERFTSAPGGRWPANVVLDEYQAAEMDRQSLDVAGGASRFFYVSKADSAERPSVNGIAHPTVKPLSLMRWLVRLVTPPNGVVLEPFAGSGTTVEACLIEGFRCIAIEREADYIPLILSRINKPTQEVLPL